MRVIEITQELIENAWPYALPWVEKANRRGNSRYPASDLLRDIQEGKKRLYKIIDGKKFVWLVLGCIENSQNRTCVVYCISGKGLLEMVGRVVEYCEFFARYNQCQYITGHGRAGWIRDLKKFGWKELSRTCGKEL